MLFRSYISGDITIICDGEIAEGKEVFVLNAEGVQEVLADGDYTLSDGYTITVVDGIVNAMVEPEVDEEMSEELPAGEGVEVTSTEDPAEIAEVVDNNAEELAVLQEQVAELVDIVSEVAAENAELRKKFAKFSKQPAGVSAKVEITKESSNNKKGASRFF